MSDLRQYSHKALARRVICALAVLLLMSCGVTPSIQPQHYRFHLTRHQIFRKIQLGLRRTWLLYRLDRSHTRILVYAYRGGPLASFGHNHVIEVKHERGLWLTNGKQGMGWLCFGLRSMIVDSPAIRRRLGPGFKSVISPSATRATRRHMLESLDAQRYPDVLLAISSSLIPDHSWLIHITLHGKTWSHNLSLVYASTPLHVLARTKFDIRQSYFGIHPYAILGGALHVRNRITLDAQITASRVHGHSFTYTDFIQNWCPGGKVVS